MTFEQIIWGTTAAIFFVSLIYILTGWQKILDCYKMWLTKEYWKPYNIVEVLSWAAKAIIIVPGLIFDIQIWWLYFFTLITSLSLIWASNEKLLPTLVGFNTIWAWLSCMVLAQTLVQ